jgi:hypothetical protein
LVYLEEKQTYYAKYLYKVPKVRLLPSLDICIAKRGLSRCLFLKETTCGVLEKVTPGSLSWGRREGKRTATYKCLASLPKDNLRDEIRGGIGACL